MFKVSIFKELDASKILQLLNISLEALQHLKLYGSYVKQIWPLLGSRSMTVDGCKQHPPCIQMLDLFL